MRNIFFIFFLFSSLNEKAASYLKVLYIADHKIECNQSQACLLTRESPTGEWKSFDYTIEGFNYLAGYEYCILLEVQMSSVSKPTFSSDSVNVKYVLSEIKSKTKTDSSKNTDIPKTYITDSSKWMLYKLKRKDGTQTFSISKVYLQFGMANEIITGNTDCNTFHAGFSIDSAQLKLKDLAVTNSPCGKHALQPEILKVLNEMTNYKVTSKLLYLYKGKYLLALFTRKK